MSNNKAIEIILRVRPVPQVHPGICTFGVSLALDLQKNEIVFKIPKDESQGYINNQKETMKFKFDKIFDKDAQQEKIFDLVAKEVVEAAVEGYNGTIFAYGQTGSGKTFTITGPDTEDGQGIIPRTLKHLFYLSQVKEMRIKINIQYLQIYNGAGYDLLDEKAFDPKNEAKDRVQMLQDLNKVRTMQNSNGDIHLQNLSSRQPKTYEDAFGLMLIGNINRVTCKTLKNDESTRSHCIFRILVQNSPADSNVKKVAIINLVDLSGSEKLKQKDYDDKIQKQAININVCLHYLQRLIVQLNKKMNGQNVHIPYRQSLLNQILRDSIGGNCITRMVATISPKPQDLLQSISTCRFSQRVALIKNTIQKNQTLDFAAIIAHYKKQNAQLKAELALLKGQNVKDELDKWQIEDCQKACQRYVESDNPNDVLIMDDRLKINQCFYYLKNLIRKGGISISQTNKTQNGEVVQKTKVSSVEEERFQDQIKKLKLMLLNKDNQIAILLSLISKKRGEQNAQSLPINRLKPQQQQMLKSIVHQKPIQFEQERIMKLEESKIANNKNLKKHSNLMSETEASKIDDQSAARNIIGNRPIDVKEIENMLIRPVNISNEDLLDEAKAFEAFRLSSRRYEALKKNNQIHTEKMKLGKEMAKNVQQAREKVARLKDRLEELQRQNAVKNLMNGVEFSDPEQEAIREQMVKTKEDYKESSQKLKGLKLQIQNIQALQKRNVEQLQNDFIKYVKFKKQQQQQQHSTAITTFDSSVIASSIKDVEVQKNLQSFFKLRDEIRKR